jgi:hypothetical protein
LLTWLLEALPSASNQSHTLLNGAQGGMGSAYFRYCYGKHINADEDLIILELAINDLPYTFPTILEHSKNQERLLRSLLALQHEPAVLLLGFPNNYAYANSEMTLHSLAVLYDVPLISFRDLYFSWVFTKTETVDDINSRFHIDKFHPDEKGHELVGVLLISYIQQHVFNCDKSDVFMTMWNAILQPGQSFAMPLSVALWPNGMFQTSPVCCSAQTVPPSLVPHGYPEMTYNDWTFVQINHKYYWQTKTPGRSIVFSLHAHGSGMQVYVFALKANYLNGTCGECWLSYQHLTGKTTLIETTIDSDFQFNIGFKTFIGATFADGNHTVTCQMINGTDFRIISILAD